MNEALIATAIHILVMISGDTSGIHFSCPVEYATYDACNEAGNNNIQMFKGLAKEYPMSLTGTKSVTFTCSPKTIPSKADQLVKEGIKICTVK